MFVAPLPRGDYVAQVENSFLNQVENRVTLSLRLACKNKIRMCETIVDFLIYHPHQGLQQYGRDLLQGLASAVGVEHLEDSDQLHGKPFALTVWRDGPMRFSCRPVTDARLIPRAEMASGRGMRPLAHSLILANPINGDGDGPNAA